MPENRTDLDPNYKRDFSGLNGSRTDPAGRMAALLGFNEGPQHAAISTFLKTGGRGMDPRVTAWCAAAVGSALQQSGVKGTGSDVATSYLNWGKPVPVTGIARNDVVVLPRGRAAGQTGGHVGFATGNVKPGYIEIISGNHGNAMARSWEPTASAVVRRWDGAPSTPGAVASAVTPTTATPTTPAAAAPPTPASPEAPAADATVPMDGDLPPMLPPEDDYESVAAPTDVASAFDAAVPGGSSGYQEAPLPDFESTDAAAQAGQHIAQKSAEGRQRMAALGDADLSQLFDVKPMGQAGRQWG